MPRTIPPLLLKVLQSSVPTLALLVKLTRLDGVVMGFTSTDIDLTIGGVTYEKGSAITPSALRASAGAGVDNMDWMGLLSSNSIQESDVIAGLYDLASLDIFICDYTNTAAGVIVMLQGTLGLVTLDDATFTAEFRALTQRLQQECIDLTQFECRAPFFGDPKTCASGGLIGGHALSFWTRTGKTVTAVVSQYEFRIASSDADGFFTYGKAICTSGENAGLSFEVKLDSNSAGTSTITLRRAAPFPLQVGDVFTMEAGCDHNFITCNAKFGNTDNFRGEPFVPGLDKLLQQGT